RTMQRVVHPHGLTATTVVPLAPGTDFAMHKFPSSTRWSPPHGARDSMHALEALTAHFPYPLDLYMDAAYLTVLSVCCVGLLFVVCGCMLRSPARFGGEG